MMSGVGPSDLVLCSGMLRRNTGFLDRLAAASNPGCLPGDVDFDLVGYLGALRATGSEAPMGVEIFSDELNALGWDTSARLAADTTRRRLARLDGEGDS